MKTTSETVWEIWYELIDNIKLSYSVKLKISYLTPELGERNINEVIAETLPKLYTAEYLTTKGVEL